MKLNRSFLLPPPNLTGVLHLGHIWNGILQDFVLKTNKIINPNIEQYWAFGFDHAGISLQVKFEKSLKAENIDFSKWKHEKYMLEINKWKDKNAEKIKEQFQLMNFDLNYEDQNYTFDERAQKIVIKKFKELFDKGLIYKSKKLINWDTKLKTAISDAEVVYEEHQTEIYYIKYFFEDSKDEFIEIATTRPETIFGDVAIFANPNDDRYSSLKNKKVFVPIINRKIPILFDSQIEKEFGSGLMKCTPAHDFLDFEIGERHKLEIIEAFGTNKLMNNICNEFYGLTKSECKDKLIKKLEKEGILRRESYKTKISKSERSGGIIEPLISEQWFLKSSCLSKNVVQFLNKKNDEEINENIKFYPRDYLQKTLKQLMEMNDWCISRQIKWGIQIPIYINKKTNEIFCFENNPGNEYEQIPDVLDTWFSSSIWPLIVFDENKKLSNFYPSTYLFTGKDILFFWVCKMIFMCFEFTKKIPFSNVYLHGLILSKDGKKMSKSQNNGVTPEELIEKYSPDVIRLFFLLNTTGDKNIKYSEEKIEYSWKFLNKVKNAFIFFKNKNLLIGRTDFETNDLKWFEKVLFDKLTSFQEEFINFSNSFLFSHSAKSAINFFWDYFCSFYIEILKIQDSISENSKKFISFLWEKIFMFLNPLIPEFVNKNWSKLKFELIQNNSEISKEAKNYYWFFEYIKISRLLEKNIELTKSNEKIEVNFKNSKNNDPHFTNIIQNTKQELKIVKHRLIEQNIDYSNKEKISFAIEKYGLIAEIFVSDYSLIEKYKNFLNKEIKKWFSEVERSKKILSNKKFVENADKDIVQEEIEKLKKYNENLNFYKILSL